VATASDPDNVFVSLSARGKNPTIRIHARAETEAGVRHLKLAGADRAISSYQFSDFRIVAAIARPSVVDFLTLPPQYSHTLDPFVALATAAAATKSLKLGTGVCR